MLRRTGCATSAVLAAPLVLALIAGAPAFAQTPPAGPAAEPSSSAPQQPAAAPVTTGAIPPPPAPPATAAAAPPAATPEQPATPPAAATVQPATPPTPPAAAEQPPPATPAAADQPPPAPPVDPVLAEVRRQLAEPVKGNVERGDRAALVAFYGARTEPLLWVTGDGFTARARHAMAEIRKADDWGLVGKLPSKPAGAPRAGHRGAGRSGRRRDQTGARRSQVCPACTRRPPRSGANQQGSRSEAEPARSEGGPGGHGRDRDTR